MRSSLAETIRGATLIGLENSALAVWYAVHRLRLDAQASRHRPQDGDGRSREHGPGSLRHVDEVDGGLRACFDEAILQVRMLGAGGVFVAWSTVGSEEVTGSDPATRSAGSGPPADADSSYAIVDQPTWSDAVTVRADNDEWLVRAATYGVRIRNDGTLTFLDDDQPVRTDDPPRWVGCEWRARSRMRASTAVFGLGGRSTRPNHRGRFRLWNTDPGGGWTEGSDPLSITMPTYVTVDDGGCALAFYDNAFDGEVEVSDEAVELQLSDGPLRYYVFCGSLPDVFRGYTALTGKPALPPRWALGYHQAKWGYDSSQAVRSMVAEFRRRELPLSGVWLDIDHLRDKAVFTVDTDRFSDMRDLTEQLMSDDIHLTVIVDPAVPLRGGNEVYESGMARGVFCRDVNGNVARGVVWPGITVFPDFTSPRAREWWGALYQRYTDVDVGGFWQDMNEPAVFAAFGDSTLPLSTKHELDGRGGEHREAHNVYGLQMNRAAYESLTELRPEQRPFLISRSGWAGMQRFGGSWSGDVSCSWEALRASLWFTVGLSMSGVPFSGPDIGGFDGHPEPELFARWFQLAGYLPFFRTHSSFRTPAREPWTWPDETQAVLRSALADRYALLPYWYSLVHRANRDGVPYIRPLCWADPHDPALRSVDDAFLVGDAVLVAPVLTAGATERRVRLPAGRWYDRRDATVYEGPGTVTVAAELSSGIPVLVRAGSVLPVSDGDRLVLEAYRADDQAEGVSGAPGGELFTDDGDGWDEPTVERFTVSGDQVDYEGPADALPYPVRWIPSEA